MNPIPPAPTTPIIKIGIIQSAKKVRFSCSGTFTIEHSKAGRITTGTPGQPYEATISESIPARIIHSIRVAVCNDMETASKINQSYRQKQYATSIRTVGEILQFNDLTIDNRDMWVTIEEFETMEAAAAFLAQHKLPRDAKIVETIIQPAVGSVSVNRTTYKDSIRIIPEQPDAVITIDEVPIGIQFHWQRNEQLQYRGNIRIAFNNAGLLVVINEIDLENYLASVNSSEMTPDCPLGLLEAQTVAARSTVLATMGKHHYNTDFHLCSDDHCQCYQGALRERSISQQAVWNTFGEILIHGSHVCDARYSKICGGIMESYPNVWEDIHIPYLVEGIDSNNSIDLPADTEASARQFIDSNPDVFCNTSRYPLPPKLSNLYSTKDLFRWQVTYSREEIEQLIREKHGEDIGELLDIIPLSRGASGRLIFIDIIGSKKQLRIGKELEIRRTFSKSHLYSSCFYIEKTLTTNYQISTVTLKGAGWGHGVGLCQVGATTMSSMGYSYTDILSHYFKNTSLKKLYIF
ncbi:SpoIID/LytB domain-containing protein [candidate division KSB1 bacterium]|nr:SpoIID/LytB domain-containing protein [candidate division KSB1 bacterium]